MNILITGITGFLGKVVLLDILHRYSNKVNKIYLLIEERKNKSTQEIFKQIYLNHFLKCKFENSLEKISIIKGNLEEKYIGVDENILKSLNINIIINNEISIKLDDDINNAYIKNYITVKNILECCNLFFNNLEKFIHISTFYVNSLHNKKNEIQCHYNNLLDSVKQGKNLFHLKFSQ